MSSFDSQDDADETHDQTDRGPDAVDRHEASEQEARALPGETRSDDQSDGPDDDQRDAPARIVHDGHSTCDRIHDDRVVPV